MPHILIVDDEPAIRSLLSLHFARAGYEVAQAANAFDAMSLCGEKSFDVVLSDVEMTGVNGHELVRWLACRHPAVHCILMSATEFDCDDCPVAGRCPTLRKPFSPREATRTIIEMLSK